MPIYEYKCKCGKEKERYLSFAESAKVQTCECGDAMQRQISVSSFTFKIGGNQMALDSLNSPSGGFPDGPMKAVGQAGIARGLNRPPKTIYACS